MTPREEMPWLLKFYQKDRSVWIVTWYVRRKGAPSAYSGVVSYVIDAETGQILHEGTFGLD